MDRLVRYFEDSSIPVADRLRQLETIGRSGRADAVKILKLLGNRNTYLNYAAVEALGCVKADDVQGYLVAKLTDPDARVICAAVRSLAAVAGVNAVDSIGAVLRANRSRPDGYQDNVCGACVAALGSIRSAAAVPLLKAEFEETVGVTLMHEYGSKVVNALRQIGDKSARPALLVLC